MTAPARFAFSLVASIALGVALVGSYGACKRVPDDVPPRTASSEQETPGAGGTGLGPGTPSGVSPLVPAQSAQPTGVTPGVPSGAGPGVPSGISPTVPLAPATPSGATPGMPSGASPGVPQGVGPLLPASSPGTPSGVSPIVPSGAATSVIPIFGNTTPFVDDGFPRAAAFDEPDAIAPRGPPVARAGRRIAAPGVILGGGGGDVVGESVGERPVGEGELEDAPAEVIDEEPVEGAGVGEAVEDQAVEDEQVDGLSPSGAALPGGEVERREIMGEPFEAEQVDQDTLEGEPRDLAPIEGESFERRPTEEGENIVQRPIEGEAIVGETIEGEPLQRTGPDDLGYQDEPSEDREIAEAASAQVMEEQQQAALEEVAAETPYADGVPPQVQTAIDVAIAASQIANRNMVRGELNMHLDPLQSLNPGQIAKTDVLRAAIYEEEELSAQSIANIVVTTFNDVTTLNGEVPSERERAIAEDAVQAKIDAGLVGDVAIANLLIVRDYHWWD